MSTQEGNAATTRVNANVPTHLWQRFDEVARANYRSRSDHLRFLMAEAVREHDDRNKGIAVGTFDPPWEEATEHRAV